jgi:hypothetical protein
MLKRQLEYSNTLIRLSCMAYAILNEYNLDSILRNKIFKFEIYRTISCGLKTNQYKSKSITMLVLLVLKY